MRTAHALPGTNSVEDEQRIHDASNNAIPDHPPLNELRREPPVPPLFYNGPLVDHLKDWGCCVLPDSAHPRRGER